MKKLVLVFMLIGMALQGMGQPPRNLTRQVTLQKGSVRIDTVMQQVRRQTALKFAFNSQQVKASKKITIDKATLSVEEVLNKINAATGAKFKEVGGHIVLQNQGQKKAITQGPLPKAAAKRKPVGTPSKRTVVKKNRLTSTQKKSNNIKKAATETATKSKIQQKQLPVTGDTVIQHTIDSIAYPPPSTKDSLYTDTKVPLAVQVDSTLNNQLTNTTTPSITAPGKGTTGERLFWIAAGVEADELFYPNGQLHIGYKDLYAIVGWNNGSCLCHVRGGIGYNFQLVPGWQLKTEGTVGFTGATYPESTLPKVTVKNSLYKLSVLGERTIGKRFSIAAGPVINGLYTRYFSYDQEGNKQLTAVGMLLPEEMNGDETYTSIEAPYTLINTYKKEHTTNWKLWIGAEVGVYYKINFSLKK